jgi:hypothetical protein
VSAAQRILAVIVGIITAVLLVESYAAMVDAARDGGRAFPLLWPVGTEALALAMEASVLEAKRQRQRAVLRMSWLLLIASMSLSTFLQIVVAPPTLVGYLTAGATPVWMLGSFWVLSLLYRADPAPTISADDQRSTADAAPISAEPAPTISAPAPTSAEPSADAAPISADDQRTSAEPLTKRERAERAWSALSADGAPVTGAQLAAAADLSQSYARSLVAQFQGNGHRS